jgi:hypothetical protein
MRGGALSGLITQHADDEIEREFRLASDEAGFVNGEDLYADGGQHVAARYSIPRSSRG